MPGVYGGDDVSAVVFDAGSSLLRGGWAGEDSPRVVIPSSYGWVPSDENDASSSSAAPAPAPSAAAEGDGDATMAEGNGDAPKEEQAVKTEAADSRIRGAKYLAKKATPDAKGKKRFFGDFGVGSYRKGTEISPTVVDGIVQSAPDLYHLLDHAYSTLGADSTEHPLMLTDTTSSPREMREDLTELAFEGLGVPAYYLANSTVLSSFSAGKPTSLILDVGYSSASAIPVVDGFVIRKGIFRQNDLGGAAVSRAFAHELRNPPARSPRAGGAIEELIPRYRVKSRKPVEAGKEAQWEQREAALGASQSYKAFQEGQLLHEVKESIGQVLDSPWDEGLALSRPARSFEFPNGYNDVFGIERYRASEVLFNPQLWNGVQGVLPTTASSAPGTQPAASTASSAIPLAQMVVDSISSVDVDSRATLLSNIVCVGGTTFLPGFVDRLSYELSIRQPAQRVKIHAPGNSVERRHAAWLGGSILASLGSFHQIWISKQEYEEHGSQIVHARAR
ncbi:Actin/actin-like protein [Jaminaea rosea]|uniref:Actin/actin-like protein n=1 Tax=Jaminaea rosea TaxID=1569628 RepID=A0A316V210_9BASI|nr:Actin/actin-like protein [Jaminaea rosea]PWN30591.1 Actin/actin-like protein [Jaminaea rosea]